LKPRTAPPFNGDTQPELRRSFALAHFLNAGKGGTGQGDGLVCHLANIALFVKKSTSIFL
jgi:hypothetical protein